MEEKVDRLSAELAGPVPRPCTRRVSLLAIFGAPPVRARPAVAETAVLELAQRGGSGGGGGCYDAPGGQSGPCVASRRVVGAGVIYPMGIYTVTMPYDFLAAAAAVTASAATAAALCSSSLLPPSSVERRQRRRQRERRLYVHISLLRTRISATTNDDDDDKEEAVASSPRLESCFAVIGKLRNATSP